MLVEIVIASVLAISIAFYLLNLTYKFKNTNDDIQQSYIYVKDKILITKSIMSDLERGTVLEIVHPNRNNYQILEFNLQLDNNVTEKRRLEATKVGGTTVIKYGKIDNTTRQYDTNDISYYEKALDKSLIITEIIFNKKHDAVYIELPIESIYDDNDYSIKLVGYKKYRVDTNIKSAPTDDATSWVSHWYGYNVDHTLNPGEINYPSVGNSQKNDIVLTLEVDGKRVAYGSDPFLYLPYNTTIVISEILYKNESGNMVPILGYGESNKISIKILNDTDIFVHINDSDRANIKYIEKTEEEGLISKLEVGRI